jgi:uncharacterized protein (DUF1499 family)
MFIALARWLALSAFIWGEESNMSEEQTGEQTGETVEQVVEERPMATPGAVAPAAKPSSWNGKLVLLLAVTAVLWGLGSAIGTGWGLWTWQSGFAGVAYAFYFALAVVALGLLIGWLTRKSGGGGKWLRWLGIAVALGYVGWFASWKYQERSVPAIHDISTDLADPPQFQTLELRADNIDNVPGINDEAMRGLSPQQRWETIHRNAYADVRTVRIPQPMAEVIGKAERIAKTRGWDIAIADPTNGRLEATDTITLFRFKDDIVLRVRSTEDGSGSVVDMRSVSRVGDSDRGSNARRIREFLADLSGTVSAG